jgi:hypothetical protein
MKIPLQKTLAHTPSSTPQNNTPLTIDNKKNNNNNNNNNKRELVSLSEPLNQNYNSPHKKRIPNC